MEVKMADKKLRITLVKSQISAVPKHRRTVEAMGLTKLHKTVELPDNAATRGQIQQIGYMLKVEEI
jgi:large subunit ribosomal protein L30